MRRTKLRDRILPDYTRGEEIFNTVSHIVGAALGVVALAMCVIIGILHHNPAGIVTGAVFGVTMITLYTMSSIYHGLKVSTSKKVFQILDHCTIYLLIAGTYTPLLICAVRPLDPVACWVTFGFEWGTAALAITLNAIDLRKFKRFSMFCYILLGWCIVFSLKTVYRALSRGAFWLLLGGGILYTVGAILFSVGSKVRYFHSAFHCFVLAGSACHTLTVLSIM